MGAKVLVSHPSAATRARWVGALRRGGHDAEGVDPPDLAGRLRPGTEVVVVGDERSSGAIALCEEVAARAEDVAWIPAAPSPGVQDALRALRAGACAFVATDAADVERRVRDAVGGVLEDRYIRATLAELESADPEASGTLLGVSAAMREVRARIPPMARAGANVLLVGETGTGKELAARALHRASGRQGRFVAVNCSALVEGLLESELFGHEKGAFTGATRRQPGLFARADGGTLFLDEIGTMPLALQAKLLRVLERRTVRAVGSDRELPVDVRLLAATNADLGHEVRRGRFRSDLLYRLDVLRLDLPALRERTEDVLPLAYAFLRREAGASGKPVVGLTHGAARRLLRYDWPGNVRELEACIQRAVVFAALDRVTERDLPDRVGPRYRERRRRLPSEELVPLEVVECAHLARVMREADGNKSRAARMLDIDRKTLYRKLRQHGLMDLAGDDSQIDGEPFPEEDTI